MSPKVIYYLVLALLILLVIYLQKRFHVLSNNSLSHPKPYSFSRWQLVWWTFIVLATYISVMLASGQIPDFDQSTLILLGIGSITTVTANLIDISDDTAATAAANSTTSTTTVVSSTTTPNAVAAAVIPGAAPAAAIADPSVPVASVDQISATTVVMPAKPTLARDIAHGNFLLDILSDGNGISIHRLQCFVFNLVIGLWFIYRSVEDMKNITVASTAAAVNAVMPVVNTNNLILLGMSAGLYTALKSTENK